MSDNQLKMCDAMFQFTDFEAYFGADLDPNLLIEHRLKIRQAKAEIIQRLQIQSDLIAASTDES